MSRDHPGECDRGWVGSVPSRGSEVHEGSKDSQEAQLEPRVGARQDVGADLGAAEPEVLVP